MTEQTDHWTTWPSAHYWCSHEWSRSGRSACRRQRAKAAAERQAKVVALVEFFDSRGDYNDWLLKAAYRFDRSDDRKAQSIPKSDRMALGASLLGYFDPELSEDRIANLRRNGYTITSSPSQIWSTTLNAFS